MKRWISLLLALLLLTGCAAGGSTPAEQDAAPGAESRTAESDANHEAQAAAYTFDPHLYASLLLADVPAPYWAAFHNLCDALRAGEDSFACDSREAYDWATSPATLNQLFPAACTKVDGLEDGYADGVGRVAYAMPAEEFAAREAQFEADVAAVLNQYLLPEDSDFEKLLKLYDYMSLQYQYEYDFVPDKGDGSAYVTFYTRQGQCVDLAGLFSFLLMEAGLEAVSLGCFAEGMDHEWVYVVLNGSGYHCDPTWGLREPGEPLHLSYFLMTDWSRADSGCPVDDLTVPLLPRFWACFSQTAFPAENRQYCFPWGSTLLRLDDEADVIYYAHWDGEEYAAYYGRR